jgi:hypothetical protein
VRYRLEVVVIGEHHRALARVVQDRARARGDRRIARFGWHVRAPRRIPRWWQWSASLAAAIAGDVVAAGVVRRGKLAAWPPNADHYAARVKLDAAA